MKLITPQQITLMHTLLTQTGEMPFKQDYMDDACIDGRYPVSSKDLYEVEAKVIIAKLTLKKQACDKMRKKVISACRESGMSINNKADMKRIYEWVEQYGHAIDKKGHKKQLNNYTYHELLKLVTQAKNMNKTYLKAVSI